MGKDRVAMNVCYVESCKKNAYNALDQSIQSISCKRQTHFPCVWTGYSIHDPGKPMESPAAKGHSR
jgi:hypothetical protein